MKIDIFIKYAFFIFTLCISYQSAYATQEKEMAEPPQEMLDACKDMQIGDKCSFTDKFSKKISGLCTKDSRVVLCYPEEAKKEAKE